MSSKLTDLHSAAHYLWGEGCDSWVLADTKGLSVKQEQMPPGTREKLHVHTLAQQFFYVLEGTATFYLEGEQQVVQARQGLLISPQTPHYIANETGTNLTFLVISQPTTNKDRTVLDEA